MLPNSIASKTANPTGQSHFLCMQAVTEIDHAVLKRERETPMHVLIRMGLFDAVVFGKLAACTPTMVNVKNLVWATPLHVAAEAGDLRAIAWLLRHNANINAQQRAGYTPLLVAAGARNAAAMKLLLDSGADPYIKSTWCGGLADTLEIAPTDVAMQEPWLAKALAQPARLRVPWTPQDAYRADLQTALLSGCDI